MIPFLLTAIVMTIAVESAVAAAFGVGCRGVRAVALVNLVTNPFLNLTLIALAAVIPAAYHRFTMLPALLLLEGAVVVAEWRILLWTLRGTAGPRDQLLAMSIAMNLASTWLGFVLVV